MTSKTLGLSHGRKYRYHYDGGGRWYDWYRDTSSSISNRGLTGGLYHLLNHAVFKGLLFLGAGSVMYRLHTKDMDLMGGLGKLMPYTAFCFLIGTMAISALPPFNGFVGEWFTYQSLFTLNESDDFVLKLAGQLPSLCWH